jgi:two-component sensor histidine kinase
MTGLDRVFSLSAGIPLIGLLSYAVLFVIVAFRRSKEREQLVFLVYLAAMIVWSFGSFMMRADFDDGDTLLWNQIMVVGSTAMPFAFYAFVRVFLRRERRFLIYAGVALYLVIQAANAAGLLIRDAKFVDGLLINEYGIALPLVSATWLVFIGLSAFDLVVEVRKTRDSFFQNRIRYLLVVIILMLAGSLTNATFLRFYPIDIAFNAVGAFTIAYAILKYKLLDISLVFRQGLLYSIPTVLLGSSYFIVIYAVTLVFQALAGPQIFFISLAVAVLTALALRRIIERAQDLVDKLFFREKFDVRVMLQRLNDSAAATLVLDELTELILNEVSKTMHIERLAVFLRDEGKLGFAPVAQRGLAPGKIADFKYDHTLIDWLSGREAVLTRHQIEVLPQFKALWIKERAELARLGMELYIRLKVKDSVVGFFAIGPKLSGLTYSLDDILTLTTLANQTAVTIENARLHSERQKTLSALKIAHDELERRVADRTQALADANAALEQEVAERRKAEELIRVSLEEKEVLLAEIHHRVKNNLQIVSSLLQLQAQAINDVRLREVLRNSQNRVRSMSLVHEKLYLSKDLSKIEIAEYLESLANDLLMSYASDERRPRLKMDVEDLRFGADTVIPCGLIVNELMSNSLKYAFAGRGAGEIRLSLKAAGDDYVLEYGDDGVGLPEGFSLKSPKTLGMRLITTLVTQLDGDIRLGDQAGANFIIRFPRLN